MLSVKRHEFLIRQEDKGEIFSQTLWCWNVIFFARANKPTPRKDEGIDFDFGAVEPR